MPLVSRCVQYDLMFATGMFGLTLIITVTALLSTNLRIYENSDAPEPGPYATFAAVRSHNH